MVNVYAPQVFFIVFRECLEASIIITVLLSFLKQSLGGPGQDPAIYKRLVRQVWLGSGSGVLVCFIIGGAFIGTFYGLKKNIWAQAEDLWEGVFYMIACLIITAMGLALLRINKTQEKWKVKLAQSLVAHRTKGTGQSRFAGWSRRYIMFIVPFITTLREGIEAVVFVGGVSLGYPATAFPLPVVTGIIAALVVGYLLYRGGNHMSIRIFLIASSCVLYLVAAGMFSKSIWSLQYHAFSHRVGTDVAEAGNGPGSYDILETVWHLNCCNPETDNGWDVFNAILGWQNSATYGSVIAYNVYWIFLMVCIACLLYEEKHGSLPFKKPVVNFLLKVPLLKIYVARKVAVSDAQASELVKQSEGFLRNEHGQRDPSTEDPETPTPAVERTETEVINEKK